VKRRPVGAALAARKPAARGGFFLFIISRNNFLRALAKTGGNECVSALSIRILAMLAAGVPLTPALAQEAFGCPAKSSTVEEPRRRFLGKDAAAEPVETPRLKRFPKVIPSCTYHATKDGRGRSRPPAVVQGGAKTNEDTQRALRGRARMQFQTKPMA